MADKFSSISLGAFVSAVTQDAALLCKDMLQLEAEASGQGLAQTDYSRAKFVFANRLIERLNLLQSLNSEIKQEVDPLAKLMERRIAENPIFRPLVLQPDKKLETPMITANSQVIDSTIWQGIIHNILNQNTMVSERDSDRYSASNCSPPPSLPNPANNSNLLTPPPTSEVQLQFDCVNVSDHSPPNSPISMPLKKRRLGRRTYSLRQLQLLNDEYKRDKFLSSNQEKVLARLLGLTERQVKQWFRNRRNRENIFTANFNRRASPTNYYKRVDVENDDDNVAAVSSSPLDIENVNDSGDNLRETLASGTNTQA